jgi:Ca-activated chloride channel family protein
LNIGITNDRDLKSLVERERKAGISLSTLGVGDSNYNEALMKKLADNGDGSYHYLDSLQEAHKVLVNEYTSSLATIAQDLKLQLEFNPALVKEYRLIGYELRALTREQFNDDKVDAGDIGSGHTVTALYEIVPQGSKGNVDPLRYQAEKAIQGNSKQELAWLKLRYKTPGSSQSQLIETPIQQASLLPNIRAADQDFRFATAVAAWAQWLRGSSLIENFGPKEILALANSARANDRFGHRAEFVRLVELSSALHPAQAARENLNTDGQANE